MRRAPTVRMGGLLSILFVVAELLAAEPVEAHAMQSGYVEVVEDAGAVKVRLRTMIRGTGFAVDAPDGCSFDGKGARLAPQKESLSIQAVMRCDGDLKGRRLRVHGLDSGLGEIVVLHEARGVRTSALLRAGQSLFRFPDDTRWSGLLDYVRLGVVHVASGLDHLGFLLLLVLTLRGLRSVLLAETAFTLSHTAAFGLTATGTIHVAPGPTEALIALSIVLLALDTPRRLRGAERGAPSSATTALLALVFGTVHGLGFAGGLREIGLPEGDVASALVGFASGVELGQVVFIIALMLIGAALGRWRSELGQRTRALGEELIVISTGGYAAMLFITRTLLVLRS